MAVTFHCCRDAQQIASAAPHSSLRTARLSSIAERLNGVLNRNLPMNRRFTAQEKLRILGRIFLQARWASDDPLQRFRNFSGRGNNYAST